MGKKTAFCPGFCGFVGFYCQFPISCNRAIEGSVTCRAWAYNLIEAIAGSQRPSPRSELHQSSTWEVARRRRTSQRASASRIHGDIWPPFNARKCTRHAHHTLCMFRLTRWILSTSLHLCTATLGGSVWIMRVCHWSISATRFALE